MGSDLNKVRLDKGLTRKAMADLLGITIRNFQRIDGAIPKSQISEECSITSVNKILCEKGIQRKVGDQWVLYGE